MRNKLLAVVGLMVVLSLVLSVCAPPEPQIVKETVIVEKPVEKVVKETVVVTEEKVVEKVITATPEPVVERPSEITLVDTTPVPISSGTGSNRLSRPSRITWGSRSTTWSPKRQS